MTDRTKALVKNYSKLSNKEKYDFLMSLDSMGGCETYTVGSQIDEFIEFMKENIEEEEDNE